MDSRGLPVCVPPVWHGEPAQAPPEPPWGHRGVFTTVRVEGRVVFFLERHVARLVAMARELGLARVPEAEAVGAAVAHYVGLLSPARAWLVRVSWLEAGLHLAGRAVMPMAGELEGVPEVCERASPHLKTLAYGTLAERMGRLDGGRQELLLVSPEGNLLEGATCSLVFVPANGPWLSPAQGCLPGLTLGLLQEALAGRLVRRQVPVAELAGMEEVLCVGTGREVVALGAVPALGWVRRGTGAAAALKSIYAGLKARYAAGHERA